MQFKINRYAVMSFLVVLGILFVILALNALMNDTIKFEKYPTPEPSEIALFNAIVRHKNGELVVVDLSTVTIYSWDRVYIFGPYTEDSEIGPVAGRFWRNSCFTTIAGSDGLALLLFTKNKRTVGCIEFPRDEADFAALASHESGFSVQSARFILNERRDMVWIGDK